MPVGLQSFGYQTGPGGSNYASSFGPNPDIGESARMGWLFGGQQGLQNQKDIATLQANAGLQQAQIGANAAMYPASLQQQRFGSVFPWIQGQANKITPALLGQTGGASGAAASGGFGGGGPNITVGGVWNPQQVQGQVNLANAKSDQSTQTQNTQQAQQLSGRGFGANSPLLQSLYGQNAASNLANKTAAENTLRYNAAQGNQQAILNSQQAAAQTYGQRQQEALQARGQTLGTYNALLAALSGLV